MSNAVSALPAEPAAFPDSRVAPLIVAPPAAWSLGQRVVFRFGFVYLLLFCGPMVLDALPFVGEMYGQAWQGLLLWVGRELLGISEIPVMPTGSGDKTIDYIDLSCRVVLALVATVVWSVIGWRQREHERLYRGLRVLVRYTLAFIMLSYGVIKLFGGQFPPPPAGRLLQRLGDFSPMGLLWTFMGASKAYVVFSGAAETLGAVLVLFRRTATLGALVLSVVLTNVVVLNFCYDVPVKIHSSHYLAMSIFLLLPDLRRLGNVLLFNRPTEPLPAPPGFRRRWLRISVPIAKAALILLMLSQTVMEARSSMAMYSQAPRTWYDGHWTVSRFVRDGQDVPAVITDATRWQRIKFETTGDKSLLRWRNMDDSVGDLFYVKVDPAKQTMTLTPGPGTSTIATHHFTYKRPDADHLELQGNIGDHPLQVELQRLDVGKMPLTSRGFHWINEVPFNR